MSSCQCFLTFISLSCFDLNSLSLPYASTLYIVLQTNEVVYLFDPSYKKRGWWGGKFSNENSFDERLILFNVQQYVYKHSLIDLCALEISFIHSFIKQLFIECLLHARQRLGSEQNKSCPLFGQ